MLKVSFLGDISLNDKYIKLYQGGVNPFSPLESTLFTSDLVVGNLECITKGEDGENELKKPRLTTTVETLDYLKNIHLSIACLAQNHIYDHLEDGFNKTTNKLRDINIQYLGAGSNSYEAEKPIIIQQNGIRIALLNYVTLDTNPNLPETASIKLNIFDLKKCKNEINTLRNDINHIVISLHWGGRVEGGLYPDWDQKKIAHELIDSGADLIIGHHSHTIQPFEIYKGKHIFYSLGNFCFSDFWFEKKFYPLVKRRKITFIPEIEFNSTSYKAKLKYFFNKETTFEHLDRYEVIHKKRNFIYRNFLSIYLFWLFYFFTYKNILPAYLFFKRKDISFASKISRISKAVFKKLRIK